MAPLSAAQKRFYASDECEKAREALQKLVDDSRYSTKLVRGDDPINFSGFVEKHLRYLSMHPMVTVDGYISNLRVMLDAKWRR